MTSPVDLSLASRAEEILGDRLLALQAGNEPDLYAVNGRNHRPDVSFEFFVTFLVGRV